MNQKEENLISSERGAIMVIGLLMALSLIGTLWFLLGIGSTIAFRDRMQDAADAAAFSQAACNARAMNAIVVLNLIILVCVGVYLVASILITVMFVACWGATLSLLGDVDGAAEACWEGYWDHFWPATPFMSSGAATAGRDQLGKALNIVEVVSHYLANGIAVVAPDLGTAAGLDAASDYKGTGPDGKFVLGISLAETNIPGTGFDKDNGERIGLPVENEVLYNDCKHLMQLVEQEVLGSISGKGVKKVMSWINDGVDYYYCRGTGGIDSLMTRLHRFSFGGGDDGNYWKDPGPLRQWKHKESGNGDHTDEEKNSADIYQSWSFAMSPESYQDNDAEHKINLAQQVYGGGGKPTGLFYYSESEYYFDCADKWSTAACNNNGNSKEMDMTLYSLNWRARQVRMHPPSQLSGIFTVLGDVLGIFTSIRQFENNHADADQWIQILTGTGLFQQFAGILRAIPASNHH